MNLGLQDVVLPPAQRRTLDELTQDLDLRYGDRRSKYSAFWTMLGLSGIIATAGVLADSTATVIGAMIIAPLSTPIMAIALGMVKRERIRAGRFVLFGVLLVILTGVAFTQVIPGDIDVSGNSQISGRTSPTLLDLAAAIATGIAGAVGLARRDVAAVLPGVAIAISLVPPLAVVGVCLGEGEVFYALGALLLFVSNLVSLVIAGTILFAALGYSAEADRKAKRVGAGRRSYLALSFFLALVLLPLAGNTFAIYLVNSWKQTVEHEARVWIAVVPGAEVLGVDLSLSGFVVNIRTPQDPPATSELLGKLDGEVPGLPLVVDTTVGRSIDGGTIGEDG
ncbi:MAG: DUF389 domain-containing protein [Ornithinibacter sp.]